MDAEFIVVEGPQLGNRYSLGTQEVRVGQAPSAEIKLTGNQVAWEHCVVRPRDGRYQIADRRSGTGVYINGMRAKEHWLEAGDQVSIGETVLVFREDSQAAPPEPQNQTLLRACGLLFLFRALALAQSPKNRAALAAQCLRLIADIVQMNGGGVMLGTAPDEILAAARDLELDAALAELAVRVFQEGIATDPDRRAMAVALTSRGTTPARSWCSSRSRSRPTYRIIATPCAPSPPWQWRRWKRHGNWSSCRWRMHNSSNGWAPTNRASWGRARRWRS